jgi:hypothetical protein
MKKLLLASIGLGSALMAVSPALAADGCGPGFHRNPWGHCRPNDRDDYYVAAPGMALVIGNYYPGHGYWDGRRYWQHRYRYHDYDNDRYEWRYR